LSREAQTEPLDVFVLCSVQCSINRSDTRGLCMLWLWCPIRETHFASLGHVIHTISRSEIASIIYIIRPI